MKKLLTLFALALLPFISFAQDPPLFKDFANGVYGIRNSFKLNDHVNVTQVNLDGDSFAMIAVDENMTVLWNTTLKGHALSSGNFKGKILAVAATEYAAMKGGDNNVYKGYLLDPKTGKQLLEKVIYEGSENTEVPGFVFNADGSRFTMFTRETDFKKRAHVALPSFLGIISVAKWNGDYAKTNKLSVFSFNENLQPEYTLNPVLKQDVLAGIDVNYAGDIFICWVSSTGNITVTAYKAGQQQPYGELTQNLGAKSNGQFNMPGNHVNFCTSSTTPDVLYFGSFYKTEDKDMQLGVIKFDFKAKNAKTVNEVFDKDHIKNLVKNYVQVNKEVGKPDMGSSKIFDIRYMNEANNNLVIALTAVDMTTATAYSYAHVNQYASVLNVYDQDLSLKFQQIFPNSSSNKVMTLPISYRFIGNTIRIIGTYQSGSFKALYGDLDLQTGKWNKLVLLSKKKLDTYDFAYGDGTMWYASGFILPYHSPKFMSTKFDVILQQNTY